MEPPIDEQSGRRRRGLLIVLSSPSGAGKSTISRMLLDADPEITMSISATTRPKRPGERDDVDYHFVDDARFDAMIAAGDFVEWAHVFGYRYGTPKAPVKQALRDGRDILFDIDWQGARQLEPDFGEHLVTIFLLPPSMEELERRLRARGTDAEDVIA
jgi:guanylate kinase